MTSTTQSRTTETPTPEPMSHTTTATITACACTLVAFVGPWMLLLAIPVVYLTCMRGDTVQQQRERNAKVGRH